MNHAVRAPSTSTGTQCEHILLGYEFKKRPYRIHANATLGSFPRIFLYGKNSTTKDKRLSKHSTCWQCSGHGTEALVLGSIFQHRQSVQISQLQHITD
jgi:hypothetical protein